jgi:gliding motility-associated-like protein
VCDKGTPALCSQATVIITINPVNDAPVVSTIQKTIREDEPLQLTLADFQGAFEDVESDALKKIQLRSLPTHGTLKLEGVTVGLNQEIAATELDKLVFEPAQDFNGSTSFTWNGYDGALYGAIDAKVSITITPVNDRPIATGEVYETDEDTKLVISVTGVLQNDTDVDADPLDASLVTGPVGGTLKLLATGDFTYTPNRNYNGTDSFTYKACDAGGLCSQVVVTITIHPVNDFPAAKDEQARTLESKALDGPTVLVNDSDLDGDALAVTVAPISGPAHGTLELRVDGTYRYTPNPKYYGEDSFTYQVCDNGTPSLCTQATVTIQIIRTPDILVYEGISPNGDNWNEHWEIEDIDMFPRNKVSIYNRWGNLVYEENGYNNVDKVWKGLANRGQRVGSDDLPDGTYFYIINLGDGSALLKGYIVINR